MKQKFIINPKNTLKITFLGTGTSQGVPIIGCNCAVCTSLDYKDKRLRTSVHIEVEGQNFLIDTSPDLRQQCLQNPHIQQLDAIIYTHSHKDHVAGLDEVRAFYYKQNQQDIPVYARQEVVDKLKMEYDYMFKVPRYPGVAGVQINLIENKPFQIGNIPVIPLEVMHFEMAVLGFRIGNFTYITDAKTIKEEELEKAKGSKVLVVNALRKELHYSHFNLEEALAVANLVGAERTYLTHISHNLGRHKAVELELPDSVRLAYDGLRLRID